MADKNNPEIVEKAYKATYINALLTLTFTD